MPEARAQRRMRIQGGRASSTSLERPNKTGDTETNAC
jgi:hypothetical protein